VLALLGTDSDTANGLQTGNQNVNCGDPRKTAQCGITLKKTTAMEVVHNCNKKPFVNTKRTLKSPNGGCTRVKTLTSNRLSIHTNISIALHSGQYSVNCTRYIHTQLKNNTIQKTYNS